jgi:hypothetical protein
MHTNTGTYTCSRTYARTLTTESQFLTNCSQARGGGGGGGAASGVGKAAVASVTGVGVCLCYVCV